MTDLASDRPAGGPGRLLELTIADEPEAWASAGFAVDGGAVHLGGTVLRLVGREGERRGIVSWTLAGLPIVDGSLDGLPTVSVPAGDPTAPDAPLVPHPNGVTGIDHVVVATPDLDRTIEVVVAVGLDLRRIRDTTSYGAPMRQAFFRLGPVVLEVVSGDTGSGQPAAEAPATWFGLAVDAADLDVLATQLGEGLGGIKEAVQEGRRIATFRHKALGLSVPVAVMDDHADR